MTMKKAAVFISVSILGSGVMAQREYGGIYPKEAVENTLANVEKLDWAKTVRDEVVKAAEPWAARSEDELWGMVLNQEVPRTIDVTWDYDFPDNPKLGCLKCGDEIHKHGGYPYEPDFEGKPWKLTCPNCGVVFPTNDFGAYYRSGIDEHGLFKPEKADKSLLFNAEHPNPNDPLHKYGVDDGYGYVDAAGREHKFVGYYTWKYWRWLRGGLSSLADAYLYTGDKMYARKAAVLLDRIADVYPDMDWKKYGDLGWYHSDGSKRRGKIEGSIWETATVQSLARAYDKIISGTIDNPELYAFLKKKAEQYDLPGDKGTRADLIANIDKGLLESAVEGIKKKQVWGNEGMQQSSMACCALALNTEPKTSEWLDWLFQEDGGHLPTLMIQLFDRDGMADEAAPHYNYLWPSKLMEVMTIVEPYEAYKKNVISRDYPYFVNAFKAPWRVQLLETFDPNIGDTGRTGEIHIGVHPAIMASGFKFYGDAEAARFAYEGNGYKADGLLRDITKENPDELNKKLEQAALAFETKPTFGENMAGYGLSSFEFGKKADGKALWMYYGRNGGHGHLDRLNYSIYAFHTDLTPEMAYPAMMNSTWAPRKAWDMNTLSHNTVTVDGKPQSTNWTGYPRFYTTSDGFGAVEVESANVYPQCEEYKRTISFIEAPGDNAYAVDIFRVTGGKDHLLSFHGPPGAVTAGGLELEKQTTGTYAGEDVAFGDNSENHPLGYSYLKNVEWNRQPGKSFNLDWKAEAGYRGVKETDNIHMKLHVLSDLTDLALADGVPPQNKEGNPEKVRYALLRRGGESDKLESTFVTVAEPYKDKSFIQSVQRIEMPEGFAPDAVALVVTMDGGVKDYIISNPERKLLQISDGPATDGQYAWLRTVNGKVTSASLTRGTTLKMGDSAVTGAGNIAGELVRFEKDVKKPATAWVRMTEGDAAAINGAQIIFDNDGARNACYDIKSVERDGDLWKIVCGPGNFARGFVDPDDYSKGYDYNIKEGARFYVPVTTAFNSTGK